MPPCVVVRSQAALPPPGRGWLFLDKDGTLIEDLPYNVDPRRVRLAPGAARALERWAADGWPIAIVSNQSGVARGYWPVTALETLATHLLGDLAAHGVTAGGFYACPHLPNGVNEYAVSCDCRKPSPGLIRRAAADLGADLAASWFIGDTWMDVAAGRAAGCRTIVVGPEWRRTDAYPAHARPDHAVPSLAEAADIGAGTPAAADAGAAG
jgi:histidinol-phosphate phosphatase family protein